MATRLGSALPGKRHRVASKRATLCHECSEVIKDMRLMGKAAKEQRRRRKRRKAIKL